VILSALASATETALTVDRPAARVSTWPGGSEPRQCSSVSSIPEPLPLTVLV